MIALVLMVDNTTKQGEELVKAYGKILTRHRYGNLRLFFACYHKQWKWFFDLLSESPQLTQTEVACRVRGCVNGGVATAILLFGAKRQMALFPDKFDVVLEMSRGLEDRSEEGKGEAGESSGGRRTREEDGRRRQEKRKEENEIVDKVNRPMDVRNRSTKSNRKEVGGILGSVFGYESSDEEIGEEGSDHSPQCSNGEGQVGRGGVEIVHSEPPTASSNPSPPTQLVEQVNTYFENWCERMGDGSLRRCGVEAWPAWTNH